MALISLPLLLAELRVVNAVDPMVRKQYDIIRLGVNAAILNYVKWPMEQVEDQVDYYNGTGTGYFNLRRLYVSEVSELKLDVQGFGGQAPGAFAADTELTQGVDWMLDLDTGNYSKGGLILRIGASNSNLWPWFGGGSNYVGGRPGGLAYQYGICWPKVPGCLKVTYTAGFAEDAVPYDIKLAFCTAVTIIKNSTQYGVMTTGETLGDYSYSGQLATAQEFGSVRQLLSPYRDLAIGMGLG